MPPPKTTCKTCKLTEVTDLDEAYEDGVSPLLLWKYLIQVAGYSPIDVSEDSVRGHYRHLHQYRESS